MLGNMIEKMIGRIRLADYTQVTIDTRNGNTVMTYVAQSEDGRKTEYKREYPGKVLVSQLILDLFGWLKHTATTFWGTPNGGL